MLLGVLLNLRRVVEEESPLLNRVEVTTVAALYRVLRHPKALGHVLAYEPSPAAVFQCQVRCSLWRLRAIFPAHRGTMTPPTQTANANCTQFGGRGVARELALLGRTVSPPASQSTNGLFGRRCARRRSQSSKRGTYVFL